MKLESSSGATLWQLMQTIYHVTKNRQARRFFTIRTHCQRDAGHQFLTADGRGLTQMGRGAGHEFHEGARILENGVATVQWKARTYAKSMKLWTNPFPP